MNTSFVDILNLNATNNVEFLPNSCESNFIYLKQYKFRERYLYTNDTMIKMNIN